MEKGTRDSLSLFMKEWENMSEGDFGWFVDLFTPCEIYCGLVFGLISNFDS
jgi:hypothetical protein